MRTIKELEVILERRLAAIPGYHHWQEFGSCTQGDKILYGPHVNVYFTTARIDRERADAVLALFRDIFSENCRRKAVRPVWLGREVNIKCELLLLF